jgi:hypothetical protein
MAVKTNAELKSQIDTIIKVNGNREITPPKHNSILTNVIDSYLNKSDGGVLSAMISYSYNPLFNSDYQIIHKKYVDDAFAGLVTGLTYQGVWNATTNTPALVSGVGTNGYYYIVDVAGSTNLDGVTDWQIGDWAIFNGSAWQKIDQSTNWADGYGTYDLRYLQLSNISITTNYIPKWNGTSLVNSGIYEIGNDFYFNKEINVDWWIRPDSAEGIWILGSRGVLWILSERSAQWVLSELPTSWILSNR